MQGRVTLLLAAMAALVCALLLSSVAAAAVTKAGGFRYVTRSTNFALGHPNNTETLKASCPDRTHVYGGGYYNEATYNHGWALHSFPYDDGDRRRKPDDGWKAQLFVNDPPLTWRVYAVCAKPMPKYKRAQFTVGGLGQTENVEAICDPPLNPLSGGSRGDRLVYETETYPSVSPTVRRWSVQLHSNTATESVLNAYAICSDREVSYQTANDAVPQEDQEGVTVNCPVEAPRAVGGGQLNESTAAAEIGIVASAPFGFGKPGPDRWDVFLDNYDYDENNNTVNFTAWAVCLANLN